ncbi:ankyrin, partial [Mytilinidion resinicola]
MIIASATGNVEILQILLDLGCLPGDFDERRQPSPLSHAARWGHLEAVTILLDRGASVAKNGKYKNLYPLVQAAKHGHVHVMKFLLTRGFDLFEDPSCGYTPLQAAAYAGHHSILDMLIK